MSILDKINEAIYEFERLNGVRPVSLSITTPAMAYIQKEVNSLSFTVGTHDQDRLLFGIPFNVVASLAAGVDFISPVPGVPNMRLMFPITAYRPRPCAE